MAKLKRTQLFPSTLEMEGLDIKNQGARDSLRIVKKWADRLILVLDSAFGSTYDSIKQVSTAIYAELSDSTDQTFDSTGTAQSISFNTNDELVGVTHSTSVNPENITIDTAGVYYLIAQPQIHAGAGGAGYFHMWLRKNTGEGFADIVNSNIEITLVSNDERVGVLAETLSLDVGDIIRLRASVGDTRIELDAQTPAGEPAIPSIIFTMFMIGT